MDQQHFSDPVTASTPPLVDVIAGAVYKARWVDNFGKEPVLAADDPELRLSGHSGVSVTRLRARAATIEGKDS